MRTDAPVVVLVRAVVATTVALGLATGTGPLVAPVAEAFGVGRAPVASMLSATLFTMLGTGLVSGPLAARLGPRRPALVGAVLVPAGLVAPAVAPGLGLPFAAAAAGFALGVGGGAGALFVPLLAAVGAAFDRHRPVALVLATAGGGLGTVVVPPLLPPLLADRGLVGTLLVLAAASGTVLLACALTAGGVSTGSGLAGPAGPGPVGVLRDPGFRLLVMASIGVTAAMFVPFVHLAPDAAARGLGPATGAALVAVVGGSSVAGRLAAVPAVARWGAWRVQRAAAVALTTALLLWPVADGDASGLVAFAVVFGTAHGAYVGLSAAVAAELYGPVGLGSRLAALHAAAAVGGLVGPGAAGWAAELTGAVVAVPAVAVVTGAAGCAALLSLRRRYPADLVEAAGARVPGTAAPVPAPGRDSASAGT